MTLNESTVEDAALTWFGELGYAIGHLPAPRPATRQAGAPLLAPGEPAAERLTDRIRGSVKQGTLWHVSSDDTKALRTGIRRWLAGTE